MYIYVDQHINLNMQLFVATVSPSPIQFSQYIIYVKYLVQKSQLFHVIFRLIDKKVGNSFKPSLQILQCMQFGIQEKVQLHSACCRLYSAWHKHLSACSQVYSSITTCSAPGILLFSACPKYLTACSQVSRKRFNNMQHAAGITLLCIFCLA